MSQEDFVASRYTFKDEDETIQIVYYPQAPGPIAQGQAAGPRLDYNGQEGNLSFTNQQVESLQSPLGQLITVTLKGSIDAERVTLTLLLPPVNMAGQQSQMFETVGIKTRSFGILIRAGARLTYEVLDLDALAENVILPFVAQES